MPITSYKDPSGAVSSVARSGSTDAWADTANAIGSDDAYATSGPLSAGDKTELLHVAGLDTSPALGAGAVLKKCWVKVEHVATPVLDVPVEADADYAQLLLSGTPIGSNVATSATASTSEGTVEYEFDLSALAVTAADINAGNLQVRLGYTAYPDDAAAYDPLNWTIDYVYDGETVTDTAGTIAWPSAPQGGARSANSSHPDDTTSQASSIGTVTVRATWIGAGDAPDWVPVEIHSKANWTATGETITASAVNGLGDAEVAGVSEGTHTYKLAVSGGVATYDVVTSASAVAEESNPLNSTAASASIQVDGTIVAPDDTTIKVDSVQAKFEYLLGVRPMAGNLACPKIMRSVVLG